MVLEFQRSQLGAASGGFGQMDDGIAHPLAGGPLRHGFLQRIEIEKPVQNFSIGVFPFLQLTGQEEKLPTGHRFARFGMMGDRVLGEDVFLGCCQCNRFLIV